MWQADGEGTASVLTGHSGVVATAAWSPDGERIVTAADDGTARVWTVDFAENLQYIRAETADCLLPDEREMYLVEDALAACEGYVACERDHGRTPSAGACEPGKA